MKKYISILNVLACISVVFIHTDEVFFTFSYEPYWIFANIFHCFFLYCVPLFFMISGSNLIGYRNRYSSKEFVKKRFNKTFIPFVAWSVIALMLKIVIKEVSLSGLSFLSVVEGIFNCKYNTIYWFFIVLFSVYLCIPVLSLIPEDNRKTIFRYMICMWMVFNCILPFVFRILGIQYNTNMDFPVVTGYLFYAIAGYYIDNYEIKKQFRFVIYIIGLVSLIANIVFCHIYSYRAAGVSAPVGDYLSLTTVFYSIALFTLFRYMPERFINLLYKFCAPVSKLTFGIYLIHIYVWILIKRSGLVDIFNPFVVISSGIVSFLVAMLVTVVLQRIPFVKKFVP